MFGEATVAIVLFQDTRCVRLDGAWADLLHGGKGLRETVGLLLSRSVMNFLEGCSGGFAHVVVSNLMIEY